MKIIRLGVFETNSSSTHTMVIMSEEEYDKWRKGELLKYRWEDKFITKEENDEIIKRLVEDYAKEYNIPVEDVDIDDLKYEYDDDIAYTFEEYDDRMDLESDIEEYTTKSGEKLIIKCWYGYDG